DDLGDAGVQHRGTAHVAAHTLELRTGDGVFAVGDGANYAGQLQRLAFQLDGGHVHLAAEFQRDLGPHASADHAVDGLRIAHRTYRDVTQLLAQRFLEHIHRIL